MKIENNLVFVGFQDLQSSSAEFQQYTERDFRLKASSTRIPVLPTYAGLWTSKSHLGPLPLQLLRCEPDSSDSPENPSFGQEFPCGQSLHRRIASSLLGLPLSSKSLPVQDGGEKQFPTSPVLPITVGFLVLFWFFFWLDSSLSQEILQLPLELSPQQFQLDCLVIKH